MKIRLVVHWMSAVFIASSIGCKGGGVQYSETKDPLTGATVFSATTQQTNETESLVGEVVISCELPARQVRITFSSFASPADANGKLAAADGLGERHPARLGDWAPAGLGGFGLNVEEQ